VDIEGRSIEKIAQLFLSLPIFQSSIQPNSCEEFENILSFYQITQTTNSGFSFRQGKRKHVSIVQEKKSSGSFYFLMTLLRRNVG